MVPTDTGKLRPLSFITSAATRRTIFAGSQGSSHADERIIPSGSTLNAAGLEVCRPLKMPRRISVISGKMIPRRQARGSRAC